MRALGPVTTLLIAIQLALIAPAAGAAAPAAPDPCAAPTITGTDRADRLRGTTGADVIAGLGGGDRIAGRGGNDTLCGGDGSDILRGGGGNDVLHGGADEVVPVDPEFTIYRGDTLVGGPGDDLLDGGADPSNDGADALDYSRSATGVVVDLEAGRASGEGDDILVGTTFEAVTGSPHADVLRGNDDDNGLAGEGGADRLVGRSGKDTITTGDEDGNVALGGGGSDDVRGGTGRDVLYGGPGFLDELDGRAGRDRIYGGGGHDFIEDTLLPGRGQVLAGGPGEDNLSPRIAGRSGRILPREQVTGTIRLNEQRLRASAAGRPVIARITSFGIVATPQGRRWTAHGTAAGEQLNAHDKTPVRFYGHGGDDVLLGSRESDLLSGGSGRDTAYGRGGRDDFRSVERQR